MERGKGGNSGRSSSGTEHCPASARIAKQNLVRAVCSLDVLWRCVHYCIQDTGQANTDMLSLNLHNMTNMTLLLSVCPAESATNCLL